MFTQGEEEDVFWGETNLVGREREPLKGWGGELCCRPRRWGN